MKITVIGAGYVGLVTAACFSEVGHSVMCIEKMPEKLQQLKAGESPIFEPGLTEMLKKNIGAGRITFSDDISDGIAFSDIVFLCVGTPQSADGKADLSQVEEASRQIAVAAKKGDYKLVVEKSTVPVNTHRWVKRTMNRYVAGGVEYDVASNPEFLREGSAIGDFMKPDRIVVGVDSDRARNLFAEIYKPFTEQGYPLLFTSPAAAELIKHASNSFLAMKISYANMLADLCERVGADVTMVADGMGYDKRIGRSFLNAGIGYGGSCFPKDVRAFIKMAENAGADFNLLKEVERINQRMRTLFLEKIENILWMNKEKKIAVWGLAFKPNTDDIREAPAHTIIRALHATGAHLHLHDPEAAENFKREYPAEDNLQYFTDKYDALKNADILLILTEWDEYAEVDFAAMKKIMRLPIILDGRNVYDPETVRGAGFEYYDMGRSGKLRGEFMA